MANRDPELLDSEPETDTLADAVASLGADVRDGFVRIYRRTPELMGRYAVCERVAAADFDPFVIADTWGAGDYRFQFCAANGKALKNLLAHLLARPKQPPVVAQPHPAHDESRELRTALETMRAEQHTFTRDLLLRLLDSKGSGASTSTADMLAVFREGRESASAQRPQSEMVLDLIRTGVELGSGRIGGEGDGENMFDKLAPRVLGLLERFTARPGAPNVPAAGDVAATDDLVGMVRSYAPRVIAEAQAGRDPYTWGAFIAERTPEQYRPLLMHICGMSPVERRALFARVDSRVLPYIAWLESAVTGILEVFSEGETDAAPIPAGDNPAGSDGHARNTSDHA